MASMEQIQRTAWALNPFGEMGDKNTMAATANLIGQGEHATALENAAVAGATGHIRGAEEARGGQETAADLAAAAHKYAADQGLLGTKTQAAAHVEAAKIGNEGRANYYNALGEQTRQQTAEKALQQSLEAGKGLFMTEHGVPNASGVPGLPTNPGLMAAHTKMQSLINQGKSPQDAYTAIQPDLAKHYYQPEHVDKAIGLMKQSGVPMTPEQETAFRSGTPSAMANLYPWTLKAAQTPQRGAVSRFLSPPTPIGQAAPNPAPDLSQAFVSP